MVFLYQPVHDRGDRPFRMNMMMGIQVRRLDAGGDRPVELHFYFLVYGAPFPAAEHEQWTLAAVRETSLRVTEPRTKTYLIRQGKTFCNINVYANPPPEDRMRLYETDGI